MNVEFINPFLVSIVNVLETMAQTKAIPGSPAIKTDHMARGDVTGIIGMVGKQARGSLAITFTEPAILAITGNMLGEKMENLDETVADAVGEITNMVTGGAKKLLVEKGYKFELSTPSVIVGKNHMIVHKSKGPIMMLPFTTSAGDFFVEICFE